MDEVKVSVESITIPTYESADYEKLPMFSENRIHQRSSGNPYPNPVINQVRRDLKVDRNYTAVILENEFIRMIILPEIGGRIFSARDKTNGYDFFYRQHVIKPALIGMLGLWVSGGVEFNWPVHHRPSTFLPVDYKIEKRDDGSVVVWLSEHEPLDRMKGMVGIQLYPGKAVIRTRMRIHNRTELAKSFLWWENAAVPVNPDYQVFFPPDVTYANFHYKKAVGGYPSMDEFFNTQDNRGGVDIRHHGNTENATSYFSGPSEFDFFGGYDHGKKAGVIHYASHHTSAGKKMFTWGYNQLSRTWEKALTDNDGAYAELMAGSYSDNQPDFSWLEPLEVKEFSQIWYPFKEISEPQNANDRMACRCEVSGKNLQLSIYATEAFQNMEVSVFKAGRKLAEYSAGKLNGGNSATYSIPLTEEPGEYGWTVEINDNSGEQVLSFTSREYDKTIPPVQKENPAPGDLNTARECYLAGLHIAQYRDPSITPDKFWMRGLNIDPDHPECLKMMGKFCLEHYRFREAEEYLERAAVSLIRYNPNPRDTEPFYLLGLALKKQGKIDRAYEVLHKALWGRSVQIQSYYVIAQIDCIRGDYKKAEEKLKELIRTSGSQQKAVSLLSAIQRITGQEDASRNNIDLVLAQDCLDYFALNENHLLYGTELFELMKSDPQKTSLDIAFDYADAGLYQDAYNLLLEYYNYSNSDVSPVTCYALGYFAKLTGNMEASSDFFSKGAMADGDYCFPSLNWERVILTDVVETNPDDARAMLYLGNLLFGKARQYDEALKYWDRAYRIIPDNVQLSRNLAVAHFNINNDDPRAMKYMEKAIGLDPKNTQLCYEQNLLAEMKNTPMTERKEIMEKQSIDFSERDDLFLQKVHLKNRIGRWEEALGLLADREFIPCEGGEHAIANEYLFAHFALGHKALFDKNHEKALEHFRSAQSIPENLGGGVWHKVLFSPYYFGEGVVLEELGNSVMAKSAFDRIINFPVNYFTKMYLPSFQYYRGMALKKLGLYRQGKNELEALMVHAKEGMAKKTYGYFSTTPFFNSFIEDPEKLKEKHFRLLLALACHGLGQTREALQNLEALMEMETGFTTARIYYDYIIR